MALIAFATGCSSSQPDVTVVAQTLQSYQPGKTTLAEFIKDSGLTVTNQPNSSQPPYLSQDSSPPATHQVYTAVKPWWIYETSENMSFIHLKFSQTQKYVVGDIHHPISILTFDGTGTLTSISPVPAKPNN